MTNFQVGEGVLDGKPWSGGRSGHTEAARSAAPAARGGETAWPLVSLKRIGHSIIDYLNCNMHSYRNEELHILGNACYADTHAVE